MAAALEAAAVLHLCLQLYKLLPNNIFQKGRWISSIWTFEIPTIGGIHHIHPKESTSRVNTLIIGPFQDFLNASWMLPECFLHAWHWECLCDMQHDFCSNQLSNVVRYSRRVLVSLDPWRSTCWFAWCNWWSEGLHFWSPLDFWMHFCTESRDLSSPITVSRDFEYAATRWPSPRLDWGAIPRISMWSLWLSKIQTSPSSSPVNFSYLPSRLAMRH